MLPFDGVDWRSWPRGWVVAGGVAGAVALLAAMPAPLVPIAQGYSGLCERFPVLARLTNHLPPLAAALVLILATLALANGAFVASRILLRTRRFEQRLLQKSCPLPPRLAHAESRLGLTGRLRYVDDPGPMVCCHGLLRPRVAITAGLVQRLDDQELLAALAHERHHLRHRDPARRLMLQGLAAAAFMFPVVAPLRHGLETRMELAADRAAIAATSEGALAGALLRVLAAPSLPSVAVAWLSATEARIAHLAGRPTMPSLPVGAAVASLGVLTVMILAAASLATSADLVQMTCPLCAWFS